MRFICCTAALLALATAAAAADTDIPKRKPGLWEHAMQMDQLPGYTHRAGLRRRKPDDLARYQKPPAAATRPISCAWTTAC
ncbi:MAG: hypothetical protein R3E45_10725 [Rhodocyclaceae bacterium]